MEKSKKYSCRVIGEGGSWVAEIVRRKTAKSTVVSKRQADFSSEADAQAWADKALVGFLESLQTRNKEKSKK